MTNRDLLKRLQELEANQREVAAGCDMRPEDTANWQYAETAATARSAILQQQEQLEAIRRASLVWAIACPHNCRACEAMYEVIKGVANEPHG